MIFHVASELNTNLTPIEVDNVRLHLNADIVTWQIGPEYFTDKVVATFRTNNGALIYIEYWKETNVIHKMRLIGLPRPVSHYDPEPPRLFDYRIQTPGSGTF